LALNNNGYEMMRMVTAAVVAAAIITTTTTTRLFQLACIPYSPAIMLGPLTKTYGGGSSKIFSTFCMPFVPPCYHCQRMYKCAGLTTHYITGVVCAVILLIVADKISH